jgi:hypothetical protein
MTQALNQLKYALGPSWKNAQKVAKNNCIKIAFTSSALWGSMGLTRDKKH